MPALHLFIDTNVLLSFYAYTADNIEQLTKLSGLIQKGTLKLYVNRQVSDEFARNRETKLAESINGFTVSSPKSLPRFLVDYPEAEVFRHAADLMLKTKNDLLKRASADIGSRSLAVDKLVSDLLAAAQVGEISAEMIDKARLRRDLGNPPGKNNSLGDQINWEYLIATVPSGVNLHVVSRDGDFQTALKSGKPHQFLIDEWRAKKSADLELHKELKPFLNVHFQNIKLEVDKEKNAAVDRLLLSSSFAWTHTAIAQLEPYKDVLSLEDAKKIFTAGMVNSQIHWIGPDPDVSSFYNGLLDQFEKDIDDFTVETIRENFDPSKGN